MTTEPRHITLAIHTYEHALRLKTILEHEGIAATLQNVNLENPRVAAGVRVRISESDLPKALRIIENPEIFKNPELDISTAFNKLVIAPTDFSTGSHEAMKVAFAFAAAHKASVEIVHAFMTASSQSMELTDSLDFDEVAEIEMDAEATSDTEKMMRRYAARIREEIKHGQLSPAPFHTIIRDGLPEEVIVNTAKERHPLIIVMGTRGAGSGEPRIMGSVTAEVLDTCRFPVFTLPEKPVRTKDYDRMETALFFTSPDQQDIVAIDTFIRLSAGRIHKIVLVSIPGVTFKAGRSDESARPIGALAEYCRSHYPDIEFVAKSVDREKIDAELKALADEHSVDLLAVPNKKKNLLARFFNPTLAHRLLYVTDYPMMVIPV